MIAFVAVSLATALLCFFARPIADWLKVFDYPRGGRKAHGVPTPQTGGFSVLLPLICWLALQCLMSPQPLYLALLLCGGGVSVVGVMDDQSHLSAGGRLAVLAVFTLVAFALDPQLFPPAIPWTTFGLQAVPYPVFVALAVLATGGFVSSVNMADGINGLVPAALFIWFVGFDVFSDGAVRQVALALTGPTLVVLFFNLRGTVFLGDCGTFGIGFVVAILAVSSLRSGKLSAETLIVWFFLPVLDCLRVIAARLMKRRSPLLGGKDHFHHILADVFGNRRALYVYVVAIFGTSALAALAPRSSLYILIAQTAASLGFLAARRIMFLRAKQSVSRPMRRKFLRPREL
jgi:UDP-GlcNAc:undecaprenyl-phosphate GlcNAc-1-phosphate transferase